MARQVIKEGLAKGNQLEAVIAMLRRFNFKLVHQKKNDVFKKIKINIKDRIIIFDFEKEKELVKRLEKLIGATDYDKGETLKIVVGSSSVKVFSDGDKEKKITGLTENFKLRKKHKSISELSLIFPDEAIDEIGILSTVTKELAVNDIPITELLTATPELLIYLQEEHVLKAYEVLKRLQK